MGFIDTSSHLCASDLPAAVELVPPADALPDRARQFFDVLPARVQHGGDRAYYDRHAEASTMPLLAQFSSRALWAATLAHEAGHWTAHPDRLDRDFSRSEEHTSELQSLMRNSYAVFCLKKKDTECL